MEQLLDALIVFFDSDFAKLAIAFLLTLPIAYNREQATRIMGLRTFPLVAIATCGYILISFSFLGETSQDTQARIIQGLVTGMGFIGGGAILKKGDKVLGTASAASIWNIGAIGVGVAYGRYDIAILLSIANYLILAQLTKAKTDVSSSDEVEREEKE